MQRSHRRKSPPAVSAPLTVTGEGRERHHRAEGHTSRRSASPRTRRAPRSWLGHREQDPRGGGRSRSSRTPRSRRRRPAGLRVDPPKIVVPGRPRRRLQRRSRTSCRSLTGRATRPRPVYARSPRRSARLIICSPWATRSRSARFTTAVCRLQPEHQAGRRAIDGEIIQPGETFSLNRGDQPAEPGQRLRRGRSDRGQPPGPRRRRRCLTLATTLWHNASTSPA
ncbi:hypothetical protein HBB16_01115 [Pseudonocardia sp. MCCB 268]|nr:hypothetical protein [Pseudonocardia cytotoxica]